MKAFLASLFIGLALFTEAQPGKYAGSKKSLLNKFFHDSKHIDGLKGWQFREGSVVNNINDPDLFTVDVFQKGNSFVILFSVKEDAQDSTDKDFQVADVVEIKNLPASQEVKTAVCREYRSENPRIAAVVTKQKKEYMRAIKAWRLNLDKRRIEAVAASTVDCLNEGFDQP